MISRAEKENFFRAHYDWFVLGAGVLILLASAAFYALTLGDDPEELAREEAAQVDRIPHGEGVKAVDMTALEGAVTMTKSPLTIRSLEERKASFLASERRVKCKCGKVISGDVKKFPKCPFCGEKQEEDQMFVLDADNDGMSDEWEKDNGFNPSNPNDGADDADADGFTNLEEFLAKTNPRDASSHPDYLDSITIQLPLKETTVPFAFRKATEVPGGWRCEFLDPARKNPKRGQTGLVTAKVGEEIGDYGYVLKGYEKKSEKREKKGMKGMLVSVDVSEATVERKSDGKVVALVLAGGKAPKLTPVDVQATLIYQRGKTQNIEAVPGAELNLNGAKYKVISIDPVGKGARLVIQEVATGKKRTLEALAQ